MVNTRILLPKNWRFIKQLGSEENQFGDESLQTILVENSVELPGSRLFVVKAFLSAEAHRHADILLHILSQLEIHNIPQLNEFWVDVHGTRYVCYRYRSADLLEVTKQLKSHRQRLIFWVLLIDLVIRLHQTGISHGRLDDSHILVADGEPYLVGFDHSRLRQDLRLKQRLSVAVAEHTWQKLKQIDVQSMASLLERYLYPNLHSEDVAQCTAALLSKENPLEQTLIVLSTLSHSAEQASLVTGSTETIPVKENTPHRTLLSQGIPFLRQVLPEAAIELTLSRMSKWMNRYTPRPLSVIPRKYLTMLLVFISVLVLMFLLLNASMKSEEPSAVSVSAESHSRSTVEAVPRAEQNYRPSIISNDHDASEAANRLWFALENCFQERSILCFEHIISADSPLLSELQTWLNAHEIHWIEEIFLSTAQSTTWKMELREEYGDIALIAVFTDEKTSRFDLVIQRGLAGWSIRAIYRLDS